MAKAKPHSGAGQTGAATDGDGGAARAAAGAEHCNDAEGDCAAPTVAKKRRKHAASGMSRRWKQMQTKK